LYITLLRKLQRVDTLQSVLASITEMILSDPTNAIPAYHALRTGQEGEDELYTGFIKCLGMEEEFVILGSLRILGVLIA
jgi:V-type H+-transporting ATPase subunit H